jgi:hypothetical protein
LKLRREPAKPGFKKDKIAAIVKWVDGTVLDFIFQLHEKY